MALEDEQDLPLIEGIPPSLAVGLGDEPPDDRLLLAEGVEALGELVEVTIDNPAALRIRRKKSRLVLGDARLTRPIECNGPSLDRFAGQRSLLDFGGKRQLRQGGSEGGLVASHDFGCCVATTLKRLLPPQLGAAWPWCGAFHHAKKGKGSGREW